MPLHFLPGAVSLLCLCVWLTIPAPLVPCAVAEASAAPQASVTTGEVATCALLKGAAYCWGAMLLPPSCMRCVQAGHTEPWQCMPTAAIPSIATGSNAHGALGAGQNRTEISSAEPLPVVGNHTWFALSAGSTFVCGIQQPNASGKWGALLSHGARGARLSTCHGLFTPPPPPTPCSLLLG